jgi:prepilin-type N-terminal cleavage/methylation domain-containing protein
MKIDCEQLERFPCGVASMTQPKPSRFHDRPSPTLTGRRRGFTLVELLIGMTILGVILVAAAGLLQSNQKVTSDAQTRSNASSDARGAMSRMTETLSQAAYIYPKGSTITFIDKDGNLRQAITGNEAIAALISSGTSSGGAPQYRGVIYYLADRSVTRFADDLPSIPSDRIAQHILVEANVSDITWASESVPIQSWNANASEGVLVDGVDLMDGATQITNLMTNENFAPETGSDGSIFAKGIQGASPKIDTPEALISTIGYSIGVRVASAGRPLAESGTTVLRGLANARNVPRRLR